MESFEKSPKAVNQGILSDSVKMATSNHFYEAAVDFIGGTFGGAASVVIGQPLDTVKVKLQTFPGMYRNAFDCFKQTYKQEGIRRGLYAGTVPSLAASVSENAILFMAYGFCQNAVAKACGKKDVQDLSSVQNAVAGGLAAFWSSLTLCPTELVKCKLQAMEELKSSGEISLRRGPITLTKYILKTEGILGLYRGFIPTLWREMPGYFFFFGGYETSRHLLTPNGKTKDDIGTIATVICGGVGGLSLWLAVFPFDVIKSRMQVHTSGNYLPSSGFFSTFSHIIKSEGILALYKGLGPTLLRTFPATGGLFLTYETTKRILTKTQTSNPVVEQTLGKKSSNL